MKGTRLGPSSLASLAAKRAAVRYGIHGEATMFTALGGARSGAHIGHGGGWRGGRGGGGWNLDPREKSPSRCIVTAQSVPVVAPVPSGVWGATLVRQVVVGCEGCVGYSSTAWLIGGAGWMGSGFGYLS